MVTVYEGHALDVLRTLSSGSVSACCTSPPYFQLRSYGTAPVAWDAAPGCEHDWDECFVPNANSGGGLTPKQVTNRGSYCGSGGPLPRKGDGPRGFRSAYCKRCGGWLGELGQERTIEEYIRHLVSVFRDVRRVLHPSGSLWVNIADSYSAGGRGSSAHHQEKMGVGTAQAPALGRKEPPEGMAEKSLLLVPSRFALAMQADGWIVRSQVRLVKTSPLPESVSGSRWERCRKKIKSGDRGENDFQQSAYGATPQGPGLASRSQREACEEEGVGAAEWEPCTGCNRCEKNDGLVLRMNAGRPTSAVEELFMFVQSGSYYFDQESVRMEQGAKLGGEHSQVFGGRNKHEGYGNPTYSGKQWEMNPAGRNCLNWKFWRPSPFPEAHFAVFGAWLPGFCIKASTSPKGVCPKCRAPWVAVIERGEESLEWQQACGGNGAGEYHGESTKGHEEAGVQDASAVKARILSGMKERRVSGWRPSCGCNAGEPMPSLALDCFGGSGTTALAADRLGRDCVLIDLNGEYADMARRRVTKDAGLFAEFGASEPEAEACEVPEVQEGLPL